MFDAKECIKAVAKAIIDCPGFQGFVDVGQPDSWIIARDAVVETLRQVEKPNALMVNAAGGFRYAMYYNNMVEEARRQVKELKNG